jgi:hypothetical protein
MIFSENRLPLFGIMLRLRTLKNHDAARGAMLPRQSKDKAAKWPVQDVGFGAEAVAPNTLLANCG